MTAYNYPTFPLGMTRSDFVEFPEGPKADEKAPDVELIDARNGGRVRLFDYWSEGPVMVEFGSIT